VPVELIVDAPMLTYVVKHTDKKCTLFSIWWGPDPRESVYSKYGWSRICSQLNEANMKLCHDCEMIAGIELFYNKVIKHERQN
jgi:hypothetical protein